MKHLKQNSKCTHIFNYVTHSSIEPVVYKTNVAIDKIMSMVSHMYFRNLYKVTYVIMYTLSLN